MDRTIPTEESMTVEFKSDRNRLSDRDLIAAVVCLTNTEGGDLYLGVEADGEITGLNPAHRDFSGLAALIANHTSPPLSVRVQAIEESGKIVGHIHVPHSQRIVATSEGLVQRRRLQMDGTPQCVPFLPHEWVSRQADLGTLDYTAMPIEDATPDDLDPLERIRLRQMIERYGGDRSLLSLDDEQLDKALGLIQSTNGHYNVTVAGLLLIGQEVALRRYIPTHEVAFQVLDGTKVRVNEFSHSSLLKGFDRIMTQFLARIEEEEIQVGLFRVPIPTFDQRSFREALVNALTHRDYTRLGPVYVRWTDQELVISNPGGFVEGVTLDNLLVVEPKPRNPILADAIKRIGLAERTGRGVDLIYEGMLRYGRPAPDYSYSDSTTVSVHLTSTAADIPFLKMILQEEQRLGTRIPVQSLILLAQLREERRLDVVRAAAAIQKNEAATRSVLERLVESGLVEAHGATKGRSYTLSSAVYQRMGKTSDYVRQVGFDRIQQEQMVINLVKTKGIARRRDVIDLCKITPQQASHLLRGMTEKGLLRKSGTRKGTFYESGPNI